MRIDNFGAKFQSYLSAFFVFGKLGDGMFWECDGMFFLWLIFSGFVKVFLVWAEGCLGEAEGCLGEAEGCLGEAEGGFGEAEGGFGWAEGGFGWAEGGFGWAEGYLGEAEGGFGLRFAFFVLRDGMFWDLFVVWLLGAK